MPEPNGYKIACALCPIGAASRVADGGQCPMVARKRESGACLYQAGSTADCVYYLKHGAVTLSRSSADSPRDDVPHALRRAGALLGMEALVQDAYCDSARAVTDVTVCAVSRAEMRAWLEQPGTAKVALECVVRQQSVEVTGRATADGSAPRRVARWLLEKPSQTKLTRSVIAGLLGMKPETFSRALSALARSGAIESSRTNIVIVDLSLLAAIADGEMKV